MSLALSSTEKREMLALLEDGLAALEALDG